MSLCACGANKEFSECCGPFLEQQQIPQTPEQLMRSRYTAYSMCNIDYIKETMRGKAAIGFDAQHAKEWAEQVTWLKLDVIRSYNENPDLGFVEFTAHFLEHNKKNQLHELSEFHRINNQWFYVDGSERELAPKSKRPARNSPCPCGSGRKFKNCHENQ